MKNNERKALKKKKRNKELIEQKKDDELYALSKIDKNTWEGQIRLPIDELCIEHKEPPGTWSIYNLFKWS